MVALTAQYKRFENADKRCKVWDMLPHCPNQAVDHTANVVATAKAQ